MAYTVNEQGNTVTAHRFDADASFQTISTLPAGYSEETFTAHVEVHPNGRWTYASNRGHESIVGYDVAADGTLSQFDHFSVHASPRSFSIDPTGTFLYCAGEGASRMTAFRIDQEKGQLQTLHEYDTGKSPFWVMAATIA